jgi:hypothetical protein
MLYGVGMKYDLKAFKNMELALSEIWPRINGAELKNARPVEKFWNLEYCRGPNARATMRHVVIWLPTDLIAFRADPHPG